MQKKNEDGVQLKKHQRFKKKCRLRHPTPLTVRAIIRTFTYGTEGVFNIAPTERLPFCQILLDYEYVHAGFDFDGRVYTATSNYY